MEKKTPEQIAQEKMDQIKKDKEAKAAAQVKKEDSKAEQAKAEPQRQTPPEDDALAKAEEQKKAEDALIAKKDEDLTDEEKTRKTEILKARDKSKEDKVEKRKAEIQKEIDDLIAKKKSLETDVQEREKLVKEIEDLRRQKEEIAKKEPPVDEAAVAKEAEVKRISAYLAEDKAKPLAERREMTKEELETWLMEDYAAAQEWIAERAVRRARERDGFQKEQSDKKRFKEFQEKQSESARRTEARHPELNPQKRMDELKAQGKTVQEIHSILMEENVKYRLANEIITEHPDWLSYVDGPDRVVAEMEKRLAKVEPPKKKEDEQGETQEEKDARIREEAAEAERQRQAGIDTGLVSSGGRSTPAKEGKKSEAELMQEAIARKKGISLERLKELKERRDKIPGLAATEAK